MADIQRHVEHLLLHYTKKFTPLAEFYESNKWLSVFRTEITKVLQEAVNTSGPHVELKPEYFISRSMCEVVGEWN